MLSSRTVSVVTKNRLFLKTMRAGVNGTAIRNGGGEMVKGPHYDILSEEASDIKELEEIPTQPFHGIIMGAPGSDKVPVVRAIRKFFPEAGIVSTEALAMDEIAARTALGKEISDCLNSRVYIPEDVANELIAPSLKTLNDEGKSWIVDNPYAQLDGERVDQAMHIDTPYNVIRLRLAGTLVHPASGREYQVGDWQKGSFLKTPVTAGCDDYVNEYLRVRYDKGKEDQFQDEHVKAMFYMNPVLDYYSEKGILTTIGSERPREFRMRDIYSFRIWKHNLVQSYFKKYKWYPIDYPLRIAREEGYGVISMAEVYHLLCRYMIPTGSTDVTKEEIQFLKSYWYASKNQGLNAKATSERRARIQESKAEFLKEMEELRKQDSQSAEKKKAEILNKYLVKATGFEAIEEPGSAKIDDLETDSLDDEPVSERYVEIPDFDQKGKDEMSDEEIEKIIQEEMEKLSVETEDDIDPAEKMIKEEEGKVSDDIEDDIDPEDLKKKASSGVRNVYNKVSSRPHKWL